MTAADWNNVTDHFFAVLVISIFITIIGLAMFGFFDK